MPHTSYNFKLFGEIEEETDYFIKESTMTMNIKIVFLSLQFQIQHQNCVRDGINFINTP